MRNKILFLIFESISLINCDGCALIIEAAAACCCYIKAIDFTVKTTTTAVQQAVETAESDSTTKQLQINFVEPISQFLQHRQLITDVHLLEQMFITMPKISVAAAVIAAEQWPRGPH